MVRAMERCASGASGPLSPGPAASLTDAGRCTLDQAEKAARGWQPDIHVTTELVWGTAVHVLRRQAKSAVQIVVGHRGHGGFAGMLLGSTGLQVAGHVEGPVVIVRRGNIQECREVVVGWDMTEDCAAALEYAFDAASTRAVRLRIVHALRPAPTSAGAQYATDLDELEAGVRWDVVQAYAPWRKRYPGVAVLEEVVHDHPVSALANASQQADLLVVGSRRREGLSTQRLGSVSHGVVHHAHCPVAVVRPRNS